MRWVHEDNVIAERFTRNEIPGMFSKDLEIGNHESLIIEKENEIYDVYENMKISIISQLDREFTRAIMVDRSIKFMRFGIRNMITRTNLNMGIDFEFTFKVVKPDKLVENLFRSRHRLYLKDVWDSVYMDLCDLIEPIFSKLSIREIVTDQAFMEKTEHEIREFIDTRFDGSGIDLKAFHVFWEPPGKWESLEKEEKQEEPKEQPKEVPAEEKKDLEERMKEIEEKHRKGEISDEAYKSLREGFEKRMKEA